MKLSAQGALKLNDRLKIFKIWVDPVDRMEAIRRVKKFLEKGRRPHAIFAVNPEKNFSVPKNTDLYETFKKAELLIPDGIGIVLAARILHGIRIERVPGAEFIFDICKIAVADQYKVYIYGATEDVNKKAVEELNKKYPGLRIVGRTNGYVKASEMSDLVDRINASKAEILFLALGSPKQEKWYAEHKNRLNHVRVVQCIGGTLDTIVGTVKRAPKLWCKMQLEWLYRLISEPRRIKRQKVLPVFAAMVFITKIKQLLSAGNEMH